jgi:hypothetical protein
MIEEASWNREPRLIMKDFLGFIFLCISAKRVLGYRQPSP